MKTISDRRGIARVLGRCSSLLAVAGTSARADDEVAAFYAGKTVQMMVATSPGGGVDLIGRLVARHLQNHIPGQAQHRRAERAGRGRQSDGQPSVRVRRPRRHGDRRAAQRHADRAAADAEGVAFRSDAIHLDRQHVSLEQCRLCLAQVAGAEPGGVEDQGSDHRHLGAGLRLVRSVDPVARRARTEIPDRARLQERHRNQYRHGARRGPCPDRRLGFAQGAAAGMGPRQDHHHHRALQPGGPARPAPVRPHRRPRQDRIRPPGAAPGAGPAGPWPALLPAARCAGRPCCGVAPRLRRDHARPGFHRGSRRR